jgi:hypothetical protein
MSHEPRWEHRIDQRTNNGKFDTEDRSYIDTMERKGWELINLLEHHRSDEKEERKVMWTFAWKRPWDEWLTPKEDVRKTN